MSTLQLARKGYEAYGSAAGWKNYQGNPMPQWHELPENIRLYWQAAAEEITRYLEVPNRCGAV